MKYALHPDWVQSRSDGDSHYTSERELAFCYQLQREEYLLIDDRRMDRRTYVRAMARAEELGLIHLYPRFDGNYTLPKAP